MYDGTDHGVYVSSDAGATWDTLNQGFGGGTTIAALTEDASGSSLHPGTGTGELDDTL